MYTAFRIENFRLFDKVYDAGDRQRRRNTRLRSRLNTCRRLSFALCCTLFLVAGGAACITGEQAELPTPTPDFEATIQAALAQALAPTAAPTAAPTPSPQALPTFIPRPVSTPRTSATTPSTPTFGPQATPIPPSPLSDFDNGDWLEQVDPKSATAIKTLPWIADGIAPSETESLQELLHLATTYPEVFRSLMRLTWISDGIDQIEYVVVNSIHGAAYYDAALAMRIVNLPWLRDGITELEAALTENLSFIANADVALAERVAGLPWMRDGITELEAALTENLSFIADADVALAERIAGLPWMRDGITELETTVTENLFFIADADVPLAERIAGLPWMRDGITELETTVTENLFFIADADVPLAKRVADLSWVRDGITELETTVTENLFFVANQDVALGHQVAGMTWLADDVIDVESSVLEDLGYIAYEDAATATRLVAMPFLRSLEPPDIVATESLASLAAFNASVFREVVSHPTFINGITDEWTPIVAMLYNVNEEAPALVDILLDPEQVTQEWRTVALPHSGAVDLVIIRTRPGAQRSMDLLENAVRSTETFMGLPLPTNYVGLLFSNTVVGYSAGTNYSTHIAVLPEYDVDDGSENAEFAGHLIAHEVAHYYWARGRDWIDEGVSDLMASIAENARTGQPVEMTNDPCGHTDNIAELERLTDLGNDDVFHCNYSLGEGFFLELYRSLGDQAFREGLRHLYRMALIEDDADNYEGTPVGILHIEGAFRSDPVKAVINRWYHGTVP